MNHTQIREARQGGDSPWEILSQLVHDGVEFPDASARIAAALRLDAEEVEAMERDYDECC